MDAALDEVAEKYDIVMPLAGLLGDDVQQVIDRTLRDGLYIGLSDVEGVPAHQVLLRSDDADWQLWIAAGETPLLLKLVETDITEPSEPPEYLVELAVSPLALIVSAIENRRLDLRMYELLRNDAGTIVLTPQLKIAVGDGFGSIPAVQDSTTSTSASGH